MNVNVLANLCEITTSIKSRKPVFSFNPENNMKHICMDKKKMKSYAFVCFLFLHDRTLIIILKLKKMQTTEVLFNILSIGL